jgi:hypothetical protein
MPPTTDPELLRSIFRPAEEIPVGNVSASLRRLMTPGQHFVPVDSAVSLILPLLKPGAYEVDGPLGLGLRQTDVSATAD